jgi:hypothetical protein
MSEAASAKMALAFASLTGGVRFDGKRHRDDMKLFRRGGGGGESASGGFAAPVESGRGADAGKKRKRVSATDAAPDLDGPGVVARCERRRRRHRRLRSLPRGFVDEI